MQAGFFVLAVSLGGDFFTFITITRNNISFDSLLHENDSLFHLQQYFF